jgi:hypothetical protein
MSRYLTVAPHYLGYKCKCDTSEYGCMEDCARLKNGYDDVTDYSLNNAGTALTVWWGPEDDQRTVIIPLRSVSHIEIEPQRELPVKERQ